MFLIIPLVLILASAIGIFLIIWRKMPYLKKLSITEVSPDSSIWSEFFPELAEGINTTRLKHYRGIWLLELEKFLRRLRVMSMKMDRTSDSLIKKIRNVTEIKPPLVKTSEPATLPSTVQEDKTEDLKKEEQRLIIEIAKNPKNSSLYETLGDLYMKMSNFSDAKESYEAAMELAPLREDLKKKHSQAVEKVV